MQHKKLNPAWLIVAIFCTVLRANAQEAAPPTSFFMAAHVVSEAAPMWTEDMIDVQPADSGSLIRHFRLLPASESCPNNVLVRAEEKKLNIPPGQLLASDNPCSINEHDFRDAIGKVSLQRRNFDNAVGYTVVATCDSETRVFPIPYIQTLDVQGLRQQSKAAAAVVELYASVARRIFANGAMNTPRPGKDKEFQATAQKLLPLLESGRFDSAFDPHVLRDLLARYQGPFTVLRPAAKLVDADKWRFVTYVDPEYPQTDRKTKVDTKVDAELVVDSDSGHVRSLKVLRGEPSFARATTDAVVQWIFDPAQKLANPLRLTFDYSIPCKVVR